MKRELILGLGLNPGHGILHHGSVIMKTTFMIPCRNAFVYGEKRLGVATLSLLDAVLDLFFII